MCKYQNDIFYDDDNCRFYSKFVEENILFSPQIRVVEFQEHLIECFLHLQGWGCKVHLPNGEIEMLFSDEKHLSWQDKVPKIGYEFQVHTFLLFPAYEKHLVEFDMLQDLLSHELKNSKSRLKKSYFKLASFISCYKSQGAELKLFLAYLQHSLDLKQSQITRILNKMSSMGLISYKKYDTACPYYGITKVNVEA